MIAGLQRFLGELRREGICVSPAEWIEALQAAELVGLENRALFRTALSATLVKRATQRQAFDDAFERFFAAPRLHGREGRGRARDETGARPGPGRGERPGLRPKTPPREPERKQAPLGKPALEQALEAVRGGAVVRHGRLRRIVLARPGERRQQRSPGAIERTPLRDLTRKHATGPDDAALVRAVRREIERLRLGAARRTRRAPTGRPYLRRVFRDSLRTQGVPFTLPLLRRRTDTPRVVLLIDVSWSTARAAGLFLALAGEFLRFGRQTRALLFVDRTADVTPSVAAWLAARTRAPFAALLGGVRGLNLAAPSDYGRAFHHLLRSAARPRGRRTVLVVLGDGRTNRFEPLEWAFAELARDCGAVVWLVPEAAALWGTGDSALERYLPHVDAAVEVRDLSGLARGVREILRRVG